jgi:hemolysin activation/secretion protein
MNSGLAVAQQVSPNAAGALPGISQPRIDQWNLRAQENEELYIPPNADRPLGEDAGPRIQVTSIDLDIDAQLGSRIDAELGARLDSILSSRLSAYRAEGVTIGRLENIASEITAALRESGLILAWAYLPEQSVQDNKVRISVLPGRLNAVRTDGNNRYSANKLVGPFSDLLGAPVQRTEIENSIMQVRNFPGLSTSAVFSPGEQVGTSQLTLRVSEDPFDMSVIADNHGTESTGENRLRTEMLWYNPFGIGDMITINALQTFNPTENLYGGITYDTPFFRDDLTLTLAYTHNAFEVAEGIAAGAGVGNQNIAGDTDIGWIGLSKNLRLTRLSRMDLGVDLAVKNAILENLGSETEDNLTVASAYFTAEAVDGIGAGGINQFELRYEKGIADFLGSMDESGDGGQSTRSGFSGQNAGGDFDKIVMRYQRLQRISSRNTLLIRAEGQATDDILTSLEQFVVGGPNSVRAYPIAEYLGDEGAFASLEWSVELSDNGNRSFSLSLFGDYAYAKLNDPFPNELADTDLAGYGIGLSFSNISDSGNQFAFRLNVATPATSTDPSDGDDPQFYGQISYVFR